MKILTEKEQQKELHKPAPMQTVKLKCLGLIQHSTCTHDALMRAFQLSSVEATVSLAHAMLNGEKVLGIFTRDVAETKVLMANRCMCFASTNEFVMEPNE